MKTLKVMATIALVAFGASALAVTENLAKKILNANERQMYHIVGVNINASDEQIFNSLADILQEYNTIRKQLFNEFQATNNSLQQQELQDATEKIRTFVIDSLAIGKAQRFAGSEAVDTIIWQNH
jgi:uncharacterized protein YdiU (UPF0061 family)